MHHWVKHPSRMFWRASLEAARFRGHNDIRGLLEQPVRRYVYAHWLVVQGWAAAVNGDPVSIEVRLNGRKIQDLPITQERPDAIAKDPRLTGHSPLCGFDATVDAANVPHNGILTVAAVSRKNP